MSTDTITLWPHQSYALEELPRRIAGGCRRILLTAPTGAGKSQIICGLIRWGVDHDYHAVLYTNRKLLVRQLSRVLDQDGIRYGVRASGYYPDLGCLVQISSLPTERARVLRSERWQVHGQGQRVLAIIDEAHLNSSETAHEILSRHHEDGGVHVGFTATPIGLAHLYDTLVVAGTPSELRKCGALVPAYHYGPDEPDMQRFKASVKTGEYRESDVRRAIMTKAIWGRVLDWYTRLNPAQAPTILFGPGVQESIWFAEQFVAAGIPAAHIDGNGIWLDGEYQKASPDQRDSILDMTRDGRIKVLCNRFVLREGLNLPEVSHLILATVMGSLQTYLQSVGRGLRAFPGKDRLTIQDHGGHWHRHGSANADRQWSLELTENIIAGTRTEQLRMKKEREPTVCIQCGMVRMSGDACPQCGARSLKRSRIVIQHDGTLKEHTGDIYKPRLVHYKENTAQVWEQTYHRARRSRNGMTFRQAEALFFYENHYWPPRDLPYMPLNDLDWYRRVRDVPTRNLV